MSYPILAEQDTWYSQGGTTTLKSIFTEIHIVDSYTPTGNETESWDASAAKDRSIMVYVNGTILTIAGNGSGKIALSQNAYRTFSTSSLPTDKTKCFSKVTTFIGLNLLDTSNATTFGYMFCTCSSVVSLDLSTFNTSNVTTLTDMFADCTALTTIECSNWNTSNVVHANQIFMGCSSLKNIDVSRWDMSSALYMAAIFSGCSSLTTLDVSNWDVSSATYIGVIGFGGMFQGCSSLKSIDVSKWNLASCKYIDLVFANCTSLTTLDVSNWDTSKIEKMEGTFLNCKSLTNIEVNVANWDTSSCTTMRRMFSLTPLTTIDLSKWDTSKVTDMSEMFGSCSSLTTLDLSTFDTSNVTKIGGMFKYCTSLTSLNVANWDTSKVTSMNDGMWGTFYGCEALTTLDVANWDTSACTSMSAVFQGCSSLTNLDISNWNTSSCTNMYMMFTNCTSLTTLDVSQWDVSKVQNMYAMFYKCSALTSLNTTNWNTSSCTNMYAMFAGCKALTTLDVSNWDVSKVQNMSSMFSSDENYGNTMKVKLDTSKWNTSSCKDMSFMFYGCGSAQPDVSNWDVSKVTTFDHMFAHSHMESPVDTSKWVTSSATNLNALFHTVQNKVLDVSNFDTSKVIAFSQMFEYNSVLERIIGLENFDTSQGLGFEQMFNECFKLKCLNLSSFDTRKAKDGVQVSPNGHKSATCEYMFRSMNSLERVILGENFSFNGDGTTTVAKNIAVFPTPSSDYIPNATGLWYNTARETFAPADVPSYVAGTYYAVDPIYIEGMMVKPESITAIADQIRTLTNTTEKLSLEQMSSKLNEIGELYEAGKEDMNYTWWEIVSIARHYMFYGMDFASLGGFNPPFQIKPTGALSCIFQRAKNMGIIRAADFDFSELTSMNSIFDHTSGISEIELMDLRNVTNFNYMLNENYSITKIGKIILKDDGSQTMHGATFNAMALKDITIEGKFGSDVSFKLCSNLTRDSILSIFNALKDYSGTDTTHTITLHATAKARLSESDITIATQKGWTVS